MAWQNAALLSRDEFRNRLLDPFTGDAVVDSLRRAAQGIALGRTHRDLAAAGEHLATAAQRVGPECWAKFIADAADRAARAENKDKTRLHGLIRVLGTVYAPAPARIDLIATGDYHPSLKSVETKLLALIESVVEKGKLTIPDTDSPAVYGTRLHTMLAQAVRGLKIPGLAAEASFIDGGDADYG